MDTSLGSAMSAMGEKGYSKIFFTDPNNKLFFLKQILAGAFITITMTGLDQEMMQKNISVRTLKDSQKNVITLSVIMLLVILLFLVLGGLMYLYAESLGAAYVTTSEGGADVTRLMLDGDELARFDDGSGCTSVGTGLDFPISTYIAGKIGDSLHSGRSGCR